MSEPLRFQVTRTRGDYIAAYRTFFLGGWITRAIWIMYGLFVAALVAGWILLTIEGDYAGFLHWLALAVPVGICLSLPVFIFVFMPFHCARSHRDSGMASNVIVDENGIIEANRLGSLRVSWAIITRAREKKAMFALYQGGLRFWIYPKRNLGPETIDRLRELIKAQTRKAKLHKLGSTSGRSFDTAAIQNPATPAPAVIVDLSGSEAGHKEELSFRVIDTKKDFIRAYRGLLRRNNVMKVIWLLLFVLFVSVAFESVSELIEGLGIWSLVKDMLLFAGLFSIVYYGIPILSVLGVPDFGEECVVNVGDGGIEVQGSLASSHAVWGNFTAALETEDWFFLYQGSVRVRIFPKRLLGTDDVVRLRRLLADNIPKVDLLKTQN